MVAAALDREAAEEHDHDHGSGEHHHHGGFNEHVWYDLETMTEVVTQIAGQLGEVDPANAGYYTDNAARVGQELTALDARLGGRGAGGGSVGTGPVTRVCTTTPPRSSPRRSTPRRTRRRPPSTTR